MGSPNNVDVVTGIARISHREISAEDWCQILEHALSRIKPCLKYVAGFQTLTKLLNGAPMTSHGRLVTPADAMPKLEGTGVDQKTRFVAIDMWQLWQPAKSDGAELSHEIKKSFLLLTDAGKFAILALSCFRQKDCYAVCACSLTTSNLIGGVKFLLDMDAPEIRARIHDGSISPYNVLDRLYLLFYSDVADGEKRLNSKREMRDLLKQMCDRIAT